VFKVDRGIRLIEGAEGVGEVLLRQHPAITPGDSIETPERRGSRKEAPERRGTVGPSPRRTLPNPPRAGRYGET